VAQFGPTMADVSLCSEVQLGALTLTNHTTPHHSTQLCHYSFELVPTQPE